MITRAGRVKFPCQGMTWHHARTQRSVSQAFDPLDRAASRLAGAAAELGLVATAPAAAVAAVALGDPLDALEAQRACAARGVQIGCFRPPSVPAGRRAYG
jgi:7-keto-8-aminopelargonate synthetase-like enzyme